MNEDYTYYWQFLSITKKAIADKSDVIHRILFKFAGRNPENIEGEFKTSLGLSIPETFDENFVDYQNLTEEIIVGWITQILDMNDLYDYVHNEIEKNKNPEEVVINGSYPWQQIDNTSAPISSTSLPNPSST